VKDSRFSKQTRDLLPKHTKILYLIPKNAKNEKL